MTDAAVGRDREVVRCQGCGLMQFLPASGLCRRCRKPCVCPVALALVERLDAAKSRTARSEAAKGFGRRLQQLRKAAGLSQPKLGAACRMQRTYVSKVETGRCLPNMDALLRFRAGLRLEIAGFAWLLGGDDELWMTEMALAARSLTDAQRAKILHDLETRTSAAA